MVTIIKIIKIDFFLFIKFVFQREKVYFLCLFYKINKDILHIAHLLY